MKRLGLFVSILFSITLFLPFTLYSAPTSTTSKIGKEDLKQWDGGTRSFNRRTSTGANLALTPVDVAGAVDVYQSIGSRTLAAIKQADQALGNNQGTLYLDMGTWNITDNLSLQNRLKIPKGAVLQVTATKTLTIPSPDFIDAPRDAQIFNCSDKACIAFTNPGTVYTDWWGPDKTGATDSYTDLNASIESVPATSTVVFGSGEHLLETGLYIDTGINLKGNCSAKVEGGTMGSTLKAGAGATGSLLTYLPASPYAGQTVIECLTLDGNDVGADGLEIRNASPPVVVKDCVAFGFTGRGFYVNGWLDGAAYAAIDNVVFERCWSGLNAVGYAVERHGTGYFGTVTFDQSHVYYCDIGAFLKGDNETNGTAPPYYGYGVKWNGGMMEIGDKDRNASATTTCAAFRVKDGVNLFVDNAYVENYGAYCDNSFHYWITNNSKASVQGGNVSLRQGIQLVEDNSTVCQFGEFQYSGTSFGSPWYSMSTPFCVGKNYDKATWGNPAYPTTGATRYGYPGEESLDIYGNLWRQVQKTQASPYNTFAYGDWLYDNSRWSPHPSRNRIIIPFDNGTLNAGNQFLWWSQANFVLTDVQIVVTTPFVETDEGTCAGSGGYAGIRLGIDTNMDLFINGGQSNQATHEKLGVAGTVISAWDNNDTSSALGIKSTRNKPGYYMTGQNTSHIADYGNHMTSFIGLYPCPYGVGAWTAGAGYFVIEGYPLEF